ncbi:hypothetical protein SAMN05443665_104928 [Actinomadura meyerae]|uniref:Uncharacterized protein n=2 Tax=Actinomadura meyerae TaxID=240840 RepID=A0A239NTY4_9ACTN|nr:hypothetical protein SAMN05443665_104928 [Actinomadura meyerae]
MTGISGHDGQMSDHERSGTPEGRWSALPPRVQLEDTVPGHEVPPTPQAIAESRPTPIDEATRYPI